MSPAAIAAEVFRFIQPCIGQSGSGFTPQAGPPSGNEGTFTAEAAADASADGEAGPDADADADADADTDAAAEPDALGALPASSAGEET